MQACIMDKKKGGGAQHCACEAIYIIMHFYIHCSTPCCLGIIPNGEYVDTSSSNIAGDSLCSASVLVVETGHDHLIWSSSHFHHQCIGVADECKLTVLPMGLGHSYYLSSPSRDRLLGRYGAMTQYWKSDLSHWIVSSFLSNPNSTIFVTLPSRV